jgi:hypothetical protein
MVRFDTHTGTIDRHIFELTAEELKHDNRISALETMVVTFNASFPNWKPQIKDSIHSVKIELSKLNTNFNRDTKESSNMKTKHPQCRVNAWMASDRICHRWPKRAPRRTLPPGLWV